MEQRNFIQNDLPRTVIIILKPYNDWLLGT
jgi:hypothetical protein